MNYKESISLSELTKEIYKEELGDGSGIESFARTMRLKYAFLFDRVIMRTKLDYRFKGKDMIPLRDKTIVKALLIRSFFPQSIEDEDHIFVEWFNGNIQENDYMTVAQLGSRVEELISNELYYDDFDMDNITRNEWIAAIHSAIRFDLALSILQAAEALENAYNNLMVLDHKIPFGDLIKENKYGSRVYQWRGLSAHLDPSQSLDDSLKNCFSLAGYSTILQEFLYRVQKDAFAKTVEFIMAYAELKAKFGGLSADQFLSSDSLASEYAAFFQNIYDFLFERPELTKYIEQETGTDELLAFFRMKDRNNSAK